MYVLKRLSLLKVSKETELGGIDLFKHNVAAYPDFTAVCCNSSFRTCVFDACHLGIDRICLVA